MAETRIIIKKKGGHGGHHGGAWKVAYADFVTAMMALFIVLWLLNTNKKIQEAIGGYFRDPNGTSKLAGTDKNGPPLPSPVVVSKDNMSELKDELQKKISKLPDFAKLNKQIEMTVTDEGLRIELLESATGTFFDLGSPKPNGNAKELLTALAQEIGKIPNRVSIEGHTDAKPYGGEGYSNWELSVDRANAARRIMSQGGLSPGQISQIRGYADRRLRYKDMPEDPRNRRISLIVEYLPDDTPHGGNSPASSETKGPAGDPDKKGTGNSQPTIKKEPAPAAPH